MTIPQKVPLSYKDALAVIKRLFEVAEEQGEPFTELIVVVGGTAMAAHNIRKFSFDVDLYCPEFSDDVVYLVEQEFKDQYGQNFKIDITSAENIWGAIMLRDIQKSEMDCKLEISNRFIEIRKLSIEDIFLLKLDSEREKDLDDLPVLFEKTGFAQLLRRFNIIWKWHGDRDAVMGYADRFVSTLQQLGMHQPEDVISKLELPKYIKEMLFESWSI